MVARRLGSGRSSAVSLADGVRPIAQNPAIVLLMSASPKARSVQYRNGTVHESY